MPYGKKEYDNTNRGYAKPNERKKNDKSPAYTGSLNVEGREFWVSVWPKDFKDGTRGMSIAINKKDNVARNGRPNYDDRPREDNSRRDDYPNDEIPF